MWDPPAPSPRPESENAEPPAEDASLLQSLMSVGTSQERLEFLS